MCILFTGFTDDREHNIFSLSFIEMPFVSLESDLLKFHWISDLGRYYFCFVKSETFYLSWEFTVYLLEIFIHSVCLFEFF